MKTETKQTHTGGPSEMATRFINDVLSVTHLSQYEARMMADKFDATGAPDLLEALENIMEAVKQMNKEGAAASRMDDYECALIHARAAIAKAKGTP